MCWQLAHERAEGDNFACVIGGAIRDVKGRDGGSEHVEEAIVLTPKVPCPSKS